MHPDVERDGKTIEQPEYGKILVAQMMYFGGDRARRGEQAGQRRQFRRQIEPEIGKAFGVVERGCDRRVRAGTAGPLSGRADRRRALLHDAGGCRRCRHGRPAARRLRRARAPSTRQRAASSRRARFEQRIGGDEGCDVVRVLRVQPPQDGFIAREQMFARRTEARAALVRDIDARHRDVPPSEAAGALGKIVLLAIALAEQGGPQQTGAVQAVGSNVEAEAVAGRPPSCRDWRRRPGGPAWRRPSHPASARGLPGPVGEDSRVVADRRRGADVGCAVGGRRRAVSQPGNTSVSLFSSTASRPPVARSPAFAAAGEAQVARRRGRARGDQRDAPACRALAQRRNQAWLRRGVVHHDHAIVGLCRDQYRVDAGERRLGAAINRDDDGGTRDGSWPGRGRGILGAT
ncbi:MAG: hypothetical protein WDN04_01960 [Rhodospirillales bacterium]